MNDFSNLVNDFSSIWFAYTRIALETYYQKEIGSPRMFGFEFRFLSFSFE